MKRQYITTAIDYPNAAPHMGHVLEKVLADVIARWFRLSRDAMVYPKGEDAVRFQIGTDEHGIKIQQTAQKQGMTPAELVEKNVPLFKDLYSRLGISFDDFIRTTDQKKHWPTVQKLWTKLKEAGALEKRTYTGLYCSGCERFVTKKDLVGGLCLDHNIVPQEVKEENWFFKLSSEAAWLKQILTDGTYTIVPKFRAPETLTLLDGGLEDVSFSRPNTSLSWGIPVPGEEGTQTMYVWCDALTNYFSGAGGFSGTTIRASGYEGMPEMKQVWWDDATVTHVIGKDIARFHALIWPAMLKNAGVRTPDQLLIHGFLTSEGQKMSKSVGNVVHPEDVLTHFSGNPDPLRFYLSHEIPVGNDGDFSWKRIDELYQAKLGNQLGNLLNRLLVLLKKKGGGELGAIKKGKISAMFDYSTFWQNYENLMDAFDLHGVLSNVMQNVDGLNWEFNDQAPWKLPDNEAKEVLTDFAEGVRHIALALLPFIPDTARKISEQLGVYYAADMTSADFVIDTAKKHWGGILNWKKVGEPSILFSPLETKG